MTTDFLTFVSPGSRISDLPQSTETRNAKNERNTWFGRMVATGLGSLLCLLSVIKSTALIAMGGLVTHLYLGTVVLTASVYFSLLLFKRN